MTTVIRFDGAATDGMAICRTTGCGRLCAPGDTFCPDCAPQWVCLGEWDAHQARLYAGRARKASRRLHSVLCGAAATAVLWYLVWCFRDFILECFSLWFGSGL
jgi:hypothetical protein